MSRVSIGSRMRAKKTKDKPAGGSAVLMLVNFVAVAVILTLTPSVYETNGFVVAILALPALLFLHVAIAVGRCPRALRAYKQASKGSATSESAIERRSISSFVASVLGRSIWSRMRL